MVLPSFFQKSIEHLKLSGDNDSNPINTCPCNLLSLGKCPVLYSFCGVPSDDLFVCNTSSQGHTTHGKAAGPSSLISPRWRDLPTENGHKFKTLSLTDRPLKVQWCTSALDFPSEGERKKFCFFALLEKRHFASLIHCLSSHRSISMQLLACHGLLVLYSSVMSSVSCHCFPTGE